MLPLENNRLMRAMAVKAMPWRVELSGSAGSIATNLPASLQSEPTLERREQDFSGATITEQIINVYLPPQLPNGDPLPIRTIQLVRVMSGPTKGYEGQEISILAEAISDNGITVRLKGIARGWAA